MSVKIKVILRSETDKAMLVSLIDYDGSKLPKYSDKEIWLPRSQVDYVYAAPKNLRSDERERILTITDWIAKEKGL